MLPAGDDLDNKSNWFGMSVCPDQVDAKVTPVALS